MQQRIVTLVWIGLGLAVSFGETANAKTEECLSAPRPATPAGQHWYYRIDRSTKNHCWYLADQGAKVSKAASKPASPPVAENTPPAQLDESVADARAELPAPNTDANTPPIAISQPAPQPNLAISNNDPLRLTAHDLITQPPITLAERLPLPDEFQPTARQPEQAAQTTGQARIESPARYATPQGPHIGPVQILLCVLAIALALAAIFGRPIFQYAAKARIKKTAQNRRPQVWPDENSRNRLQPSYAQMITPERRARSMRLDQDVTEIERLLRAESERIR